MVEKVARRDPQTMLWQLQEELKGKEQGYIHILKVGEGIFQYSLLPQVEIVLLDPEENTIAYRCASDTDARARKKGIWQVGKPFDAVEVVTEWTDLMIEAKFGRDN